MRKATEEMQARYVAWECNGRDIVQQLACMVLLSKAGTQVLIEALKAGLPAAGSDIHAKWRQVFDVLEALPLESLPEYWIQILDVWKAGQSLPENCARQVFDVLERLPQELWRQVFDVFKTGQMYESLSEDCRLVFDVLELLPELCSFVRSALQQSTSDLTQVFRALKAGPIYESLSHDWNALLAPASNMEATQASAERLFSLLHQMKEGTMEGTQMSDCFADDWDALLDHAEGMDVDLERIARLKAKLEGMRMYASCPDGWHALFVLAGSEAQMEANLERILPLLDRMKAALEGFRLFQSSSNDWNALLTVVQCSTSQVDESLARKEAAFDTEPEDGILGGMTLFDWNALLAPASNNMEARAQNFFSEEDGTILDALPVQLRNQLVANCLCYSDAVLSQRLPFDLVDPHRLLENHRRILHDFNAVDVEELKAEAAPRKAQVMQRISKHGPPSQFRLIDCKSTRARKRVVLVDGLDHQDDYTALSHTWGEAVYRVFDCECACECFASKPRCHGEPCQDSTHGEVVGVILKMCERLMDAGSSNFLWHDGVCIAQHDAAEVTETISHMGWIYAAARDTIIFFDYVGKPVALLPSTRWNRRVWTLQEAILSQRRRYCIRVVSWEAGQDFDTRLAHSYEDDSCIKVLEEESLWQHLLEMFAVVISICENSSDTISKMLASIREGLVEGRWEGLPDINLNVFKAHAWLRNLMSWALLMRFSFFTFPSLSSVLIDCADERESKHVGDRINSVLGLADVTHFVAPKDGNMEASTLEFFKAVGEDLIREALFWVNEHQDMDKRHSWLPSLCNKLYPAVPPEQVLSIEAHDQLVSDDAVRCVVLENGMLELRGRMCLVPVEFTFNSELENLQFPGQFPDDLSSSPAVYRMDDMEHLYNNSDHRILTMDLCDKAEMAQPASRDAFSRTSRCPLGKVVVPPESLVKLQPAHAAGCSKQSFVAHLLFGDFAWDLQSRLKNVRFNVRFLTDFHRWDFEGLREESAGYSPHALIVLGKDLHRPVTKLGHFLLNRLLRPLILKEKLFPMECLDHLVIN